MKQAVPKQGREARSARAGPAPAPFFRPRPPLQAKLTVSRRGEKLEQEADHAADAVVHKRGPMTRGGRISQRMTPIAQRMEEDTQAASEGRHSDPAWHEHEPVPCCRHGSVEDEPLQMKEAGAQDLGEPDAPTREETVRAREAEQRQPVQAQAEAAQETVQEQAGGASPGRADGHAAAQANEEQTQARPGAVQAQSEQAESEEEQAQARPEDFGKDEQAQRADDEEAVQRRAAGPALSARATRLQHVERQLRASRGRGNPLPDGVRRKMEQGLGADFSGVRIHTDHPAFLMTKMLNAKAFTSGRDIFFSPHRFAPGTTDGDHLLAHELAHTLQQAAVPVRDEAVAQRTTEDALAQRAPEADRQSVRPETIKALRIAYSYEGKINSNLTGADGNRIGWLHLKKIFHAAFERDPFPDPILKRPLAHPHDLPHWCGIFAWHALKEAGFPLPPWKPGRPMLEHTKMRPPGELPQVGDIAYRDKLPNMPDSAPLTHHQALVSAVESEATAKGKSLREIEITTIDGNTAGSNNMGGQVQETRQPAANWKRYFDPAGKVNMPPVERVTIDRSSTDFRAATPETLPETAPGETIAPTDVSTLEAEATPEAEAPAGAQADVAVDLGLPPPVEVAVEPAAKIGKASLEGSSDQAAAGFTRARPSTMAATAPGLGSALDAKTRAEKQAVAETTPELRAQTGGVNEPGITPPDQIPTPADVTLEDAGQGPEVGRITPTPHADKDKAPSTSDTYVGRQMRQQDSGGFLNWLRTRFRSLLNSIRVKDPGVNTSAGPRQRVAMTGNADVGRMSRQREQGTVRLRQARDARVAAFKGHPGQTNIQPRKVDRACKSEQAPEPAEPIQDLPRSQDLDDYAEAQWPADMRDAADGKMRRRLDASLSPVRAGVDKAGADRDADKAAAIAEAERKTAQANRDADDRQRRAVVAGRSDVARQQGEAIQDAYDNVAEFSAAAAHRQTEKGKAIAVDVRDSEGKADKDLEGGETEARRLRTEAEDKAAREKRELENKEDDESWWSRLTKAVVDRIVSGIDGIFTRMRRAVKDAIVNAKTWAVGKINDARDRVVGALDGFRDWAKDKVNTYVKDRYPGLAKALNDGIDKTVDMAVDGVNAAADAAIDTVEKLADALAGALDKLLARFQAALKLAVQAIGAALRADFVGALKLAFEAVCELAGVNPKPVFDFLERAGQQVVSIFKNLGPFINNLFSAVGMGIRAFADNFVRHFKTGVISWLTGALAAVPITLPSKWDLKGFFSLVAQILGLTYANIKARIVKRFPKAAGVFDKIEKGWRFVSQLLDRDYAALWSELKARLADLKQTIIGALQKWTLLNVIKQGVMWLLSLLNPASAIVRLVKMLADLVFWLVENLKRIKAFVLSVYGAISNIAAGILKPAAKAVEDALARTLPVVISFIASALGLGDIAGAVQGVIRKIQAPVNKAIDTLIDKVVAFARNVIAKLVSGAKKAGSKAKEAALSLIRWWTEKRRFKSKDGGDHKIYYKGEGKRADLWIQSTPKGFPEFLAEQMKSDDKTQARLAREANRIYTKEVLAAEARMETLQAERAAIGSANKAAYRRKHGELQTEIRNFRTRLLALSGILQQMDIDDEAAATTIVNYLDSGTKQVTALPLTFLPGNEKGSAPSEDPPGYDYARRINQAEGKTVWIRGHMLNDNVHGPGKAKNMVPIPQSTNRLMESEAESDLKTRVHSNKEKLYFRATANFWQPTNDDNAGFPRKIVLVWHRAEKKDRKWTKGEHIDTRVFDSPRPPDKVDASVPGIASGGTQQLVAAINTQRAGKPVTSHFVGLLKRQAGYASTGEIRTRLTTAETRYDKLSPTQKAHRGEQIYRTVAAVKAEKIELT